jgi:hypothetical protein
MGAVPDEKQGVASAVNDTTREVGAAIGIAVAGSVVAAHYSNVLRPALAGFPEQVRGPALDSLAQALAVAGQMGPQGRQVAQLAENAFLQSMHLSLLILSVIIAVAAIFVAIWAPGRNGQQLRFVQRMRSRSLASGNELGSATAEHDDGGMRAPAGDGGKHRAVDNP